MNEVDNTGLQLAAFSETYSNNNLRFARRSRRAIDLASIFLVADGGDCDGGGGLVVTAGTDTAAAAAAMVLLLFKRE